MLLSAAALAAALALCAPAYAQAVPGVLSKSTQNFSSAGKAASADISVTCVGAVMSKLFLDWMPKVEAGQIPDVRDTATESSTAAVLMYMQEAKSVHTERYIHAEFQSYLAKSGLTEPGKKADEKQAELVRQDSAACLTAYQSQRDVMSQDDRNILDALSAPLAKVLVGQLRTAYSTAAR